MVVNLGVFLIVPEACPHSPHSPKTVIDSRIPHAAIFTEWERARASCRNSCFEKKQARNKGASQLRSREKSRRRDDSSRGRARAAPASPGRTCLFAHGGSVGERRSRSADRAG